MVRARVGVVVVLAALTVAGCGQEPSEATDESSVERARSASAIFGVASRARASHDVIPREGTDKIRADPATAPAGIDWSASRQVTVQGETSVFVLPAAKGVCMVVQNPASGTTMSCTSLSVAARGMFTRIGMADGVKLVGLMPDGSKDLTYETSGAQRRVALDGNGFVADASSESGTLRWSDASGARRAHSLRQLPLE